MAREIWFAKQENPEDEWENGSWDFDEALEWLNEQESETALIALIDKDFCVGEIKKSDIDKYKNV